MDKEKKENRYTMSRKEKKEKIIAFIKKKQEERIKEKQKKKFDVKARHPEKKIHQEEKIHKEENAFKLNSKRRKEKREKFLLLIAKKKEDKRKKKLLILEEKKKIKQERERTKQEELRKKQEEIERLKQEKEKRKHEEQIKALQEKEKAKQQKEELKRERIQQKQIQKAKQIEERNKNKELLLQFLSQKALSNRIKTEKNLLLSTILSDRKTIEREKQPQITKTIKQLKDEILKKEKEDILKKTHEEKKIKAHLSSLSTHILGIEKEIEKKINDSVKNISNFIRKTKIEIPEKVPPEKVKIVPKKPKPVVYKEPFRINVFLRRNAFKFVFLLLLLAWVLEFFMYMRKLVSPEDRLKMIVGEIKEEKKKPIEKITPVEEEKLVYYTKEKIDIEGKRDPFSTGRLTMEVMKKPVPTNIIFARKSEVISIIKPQKFISILKPEEKISKPETVSPPKIPSVEKPSILKPPEISVSSKLSEIEKPQKVEIKPFIAPEKTCPLIYRGRMILEGVEYFFIEGEKRTYRVTVGDVVEGYKILKRENSKLYLSKEGLIYEINAQ